MLTRVEAAKSKERDSGQRLGVSKEITKKSAAQCKDTALDCNCSKVKQVSNVRKAKFGKEKEGLWRRAVGRLSKYVLCEGRHRYDLSLRLRNNLVSRIPRKTVMSASCNLQFQVGTYLFMTWKDSQYQQEVPRNGSSYSCGGQQVK